MTREELDVIERGPTEDELAEEIALYEQYQAERKRLLTVKGVQRTITALGLPAQHVPVGTGRIRHNEVDK